MIATQVITKRHFVGILAALLFSGLLGNAHAATIPYFTDFSSAPPDMTFGITTGSGTFGVAGGFATFSNSANDTLGAGAVQCPRRPVTIS